MKNRAGMLAILSLSIWCSSYLHAVTHPIRLLGIGNYFELLRTSPSERPVVRITKVGTQLQNIFINPQTYQGQLQPVDLLLPVEIEVKFSTYNDGQPYTIIIDRVTDYKDKLACPGATMGTVKAYIKGRTINKQRVCVPLSSSNIPTSVSPIYSDDFNNVVFFVGPLGKHDTYDPLDVRSLPFTFGLMGWTSLVAPWNQKTVSQTVDQTPRVTFTGKPLEVLQGFGALGGGFIPRAHHMSLAHIFNDTDYIIIVSRESSSKHLAPFNISQIVPPHSAMPYALVWVPKVKDAAELEVSGHDGVRIAALKKGETARAPSVISHSGIGDLEVHNVELANVGIPEGFAQLMEMIQNKLSTSVTDQAADLLGVTFWNQNMQSAYQNFKAADYYYAITTNAQDRAAYLQRFTVDTNVHVGEDEKIENFVSYDSAGKPNYCNIVITQDKREGETTEADSSFKVRVYPATIRAPKRR